MSPSIPGAGGAAAQAVVRRSVEDGPSSSSDVRPRRRRAAAPRVYSMDLEEPPLVTTAATSTTARSRSRTSSFGSTASSSSQGSSRGSTTRSSNTTNPRVAELRNYVNQCKANYERYKQAPQHQKATLLQKCVDDLSSQRSGMQMSRSSSSLSSRSSMDEDYYEKNHVEEEQAADSNPILNKVIHPHHNQSYSTASTRALTLASSATRLHEALRQSLNLSATGAETSSPTPLEPQMSSSSRRYELREQQPSQDQQQRPPYFNASIRMQSSSMGSSISSLHSSRSSLSSTNNNNGRRTRRPPQQIPDSYFSPEAPVEKQKVVAFDGGMVPPPPPLSAGASPRNVRITTPQEAQFHKRLQQIAALNQPYHQEQQQQHLEEQEQGIEVEAPLALTRPQAQSSFSPPRRSVVAPRLLSDITPQSPKQQKETTSTQVADPKGDELDTSKDQIEIPSEQPKTKQKSKSRLKRWFASCKCQSSASPETTKNGSNSTQQQSQLVDVQDMLYLHQGRSSGKYHGQIDSITGLPHGQGSFECSKCSYNGAWKDGKFDTTTAASNDKSSITSTYLDKIHNDSYQGAFQDNKYHGQGTLSYGDGRVFTGTFDKGSIARGTMSYTDGSSYQGAFKDHKRHDDHGLYLYPDGGSQYKGSFVNDAMQGHGSMVWKSGTKYVGEFQNSVRHGLGREFDASGNVLFEGLWKNGRPVTS